MWIGFAGRALHPDLASSAVTRDLRQSLGARALTPRRAAWLGRLVCAMVVGIVVSRLPTGANGRAEV
jgi:hypothetical protein